MYSKNEFKLKSNPKQHDSSKIKKFLEVINTLTAHDAYMRHNHSNSRCCHVFNHKFFFSQNIIFCQKIGRMYAKFVVFFASYIKFRKLQNLKYRPSKFLIFFKKNPKKSPFSKIGLALNVLNGTGSKFFVFQK